MSTIITKVTWYIARNCHGQFSRGNSWTNDIARARFHRKPSSVRSAITKWTKENPDLPVPELLKWECDIATAVVMDETARTKKAVSRIKREAVEQKMRSAEYRREELNRLIERHKQELDDLQKEKS